MTGNAKIPVLFVATLGQTDLQLVVEVVGDDGTQSLASAPVRKPATRAVHDCLVREFTDLGLEPAAGPMQERSDCEVVVKDGAIAVAPTGGHLRPLPTLARSSGGRLAVYPRLLAQAAGRFHPAAANPTEQLVGALLCQTSRDATGAADVDWSRMVAGEPHAAGEIIAMWFENQTGLVAADNAIGEPSEVQPGRCMWLNLLQGAEYADLRYGDAKQVSLTRPAMLQRVDAALRAVSAWPIPPRRVYFHHDGGIPAMFEAVADALSFRLPEAEILVQRRDRGGSDAATRPYPGLRPAESIRQRAAARDLIGCGRFADAALLARAMQAKIPDPERWVTELQAGSAWLQGETVATVPTDPKLRGQRPGVVDVVAGAWSVTPHLAAKVDSAVRGWLTTALCAEAAARAGDAVEVTQLLCTMADAVHDPILLAVAPRVAVAPRMTGQRAPSAREARLDDLWTWSQRKWWGAGLARAAFSFAEAIDMRTQPKSEDSVRDLRNGLVHEGRQRRTVVDLRPALLRAGIDLNGGGLRVVRKGGAVHKIGLGFGVDLATAYITLVRATLTELEDVDFSIWGEP